MRSHPSLSPLIRPFWSALMALGLAMHGAVWAAGPMVPVITLGQQAVSTGTTLDGVVEPVRQAVADQLIDNIEAFVAGAPRNDVANA